MPDLDATIHQQYPADQVLVYGVYHSEPASAIADFQQQTGVGFDLVQDQGTFFTLNFPAGTGYPYPRDVIIGKDLRIRAIRNAFNATHVQELVDTLLAEPWPPPP